MKADTEKIDRAVLALLYLGTHDEWRTWKSFDWDAMGRLHEKGYISDPVGKAKSWYSPSKASRSQSGSSKRCSERLRLRSNSKAAIRRLRRFTQMNLVFHLRKSA
jgi:hypothetical protein